MGLALDQAMIYQFSKISPIYKIFNFSGATLDLLIELVRI